MHSLRTAQGPAWNFEHLSMVIGWKTLLNEKRWHDNLTTLGIPSDKHKQIIQHCAGAALNVFGSMTDACMGAS